MEGLLQCGRGRGSETTVSPIHKLSVCMCIHVVSSSCCMWLQSFDSAGGGRGNGTGSAAGAVIAQPNPERPTADCDTHSGSQEKGEWSSILCVHTV